MPRIFKLLVVSSLLASATAFSLDRSARSKWIWQRSVDRPRRFPQLLQLKSANNDDLYDEKEVQEMDDLIISLSLEPTDESRRERLEKIFEQELAKPNGAPKHFSDVFGHALVIVGDRVKLEAQEYAAKLAAESEEDQAETTEPDSPDDQETGASPEPFAQQRQLWALVDMLIQSKTIIKRASGDLGNKGTFQ